MYIREEHLVRILMLAQFYRPFIGGEEQIVRDLSLELAARGHSVAVATLWQPGLPEFEMDGAIRIHRLRSLLSRFPSLFATPGKAAAAPLPDPETVWALQRVLREEQPEIVHAHNWLVQSFVPLKAWSGAKLILSLHDFGFQCATKKLIHQGSPCSGPGLLKCLACAGAHYGVAKGTITTLAQLGMAPLDRSTIDMFLPVSQAVADGSGLPGSGLPFRVIPNFAPDNLGQSDGDTQAYLDQLPSDECLLFVGALGNYKGLTVLLETYAQLHDVPPLVLIGYPCPDTPTVLPPGVIMLKNWPRHAVMAAFQRCRAAVVPSVWPEPFGIVVLEAMAAGRPVIASRIGGLTDLVVDGETGYLVPPGDVAALGNAITRLARDSQLCAQLGAAGERRLEQFRARSVVPRVEAVYRELVFQGTPQQEKRVRMPA